MKLVEMWRQRSNRLEIYSAAEYWNSKAEQLDGSAISMWPNYHLNALYEVEQFEYLDLVLGSVAGREVLDLGCGTGRVSRYLAKRGARVVGVDFSDKTIEVARCASPPEIRFRVQSIFDLEDDACYDFVVSWGTLAVACRSEDELAEALGRLYSGLRTGGRVILLEPIHAGFLSRVLAIDVETYCEIMMQQGFEVERVDQLHFWPARVALGYFRVPRLVTRHVYWIGQAMMKLPGFRNSGDYKAIVARKV